jgi:hypothetical protein
MLKVIPKHPCAHNASSSSSSSSFPKKKKHPGKAKRKLLKEQRGEPLRVVAERLRELKKSRRANPRKKCLF